jgi:hypothetical protein
MTLLIPFLLALSPQPAPPAQNGAALLPPAPDGWRYERLDFPLSFAPDIELEGYEELRFAPGMFQPGSDTYFSYILGVRAVGELTVDEAFLQSFLLKYYRGLCDSVGSARELELDLSKVSATVATAETGYHATVEMFDAFGSGQPLTLHLELFAHTAENATEIFGLASPLEKTEPVWKQLHELGVAWRAAREASVFLNHVYLVVDQATYDAVSSSEFMQRALGVFEERETVRADMSYAGLYFYGERTYFELLRPDTAGGFAVGGTGVAFGVERAGAMKDVAAELEGSGIQSFGSAITRDAAGEPVPWFDILGVEKPHVRSRLSLFAMEYDPRFLATWHPELAPEGGGISRADVLERYAARLQRLETRHGTLMQDVTEVRLTVDAEERARLFALCGALGYRVEEEGQTAICHGPDFRLVVRTGAEPGGVTGLKLALRRPVEAHSVRLGNAVLSFEGNVATLEYHKL